MVQSHDVLIVIPARLESSRLPKKLLRPIGPMSVIAHVCERVSRCNDFADMLLATNSDKIFDHVIERGYPAVMSENEHRNGTERVAEVACDQSKYKWIVNVQGDEPFINPEDIRRLVAALKNDNSIVSMYTPIIENTELQSSSVVKVVFDNAHTALDFSRAPFSDVQHYQHIGIYGFEREVLVNLVALEPTARELERKLEQMRWLDHGYDIKMVLSSAPSISIDTISDLIHARDYYKSKVDHI